MNQAEGGGESLGEKWHAAMHIASITQTRLHNSTEPSFMSTCKTLQGRHWPSTEKLTLEERLGESLA